MLPLEYALKEISQRIERTVLRVLRTPTFPAQMGLVGNMILQCLDQSRFANTRITAQQDDLSLSSLGLLPTLQEKTNFLLSTDQGCETTSTCDVQSTVNTTCS